ncbi:TrlF family AAA-like ATPase [Roseiflexus castenholzii]|jgi:DNA repair ATPase RecN|uniref:SMC domain protein n=1 Tax=Roseiflexus castenholzii (strain DSM 13941 / HLO8) TaxID=383372 RepID=A7NJM9_ROSCS|nr:AAA family ATPase [Roseiflexus castenholzii]ABU57699.1 SMC domain protein [Roseiflexus castenholzii DSM 13941]
MTEKSLYHGARWIRCDLHLHSPGAHGFTFPPGLSAAQRDEVVAQYVQQLQAQGIAIAAITDYQQIRTKWFIPIQQEAKKAGIYVYPGVELSFGGSVAGKYGLHVLAIFPYDSDLQEINRRIDKLLDGDVQEELVRENGSHRDLKPRENLADCLIRLRRETGCLLVFAHPNDENGLWKTYQPGEAADLLVRVEPDAIEQFEERDRQRLQDTGKVHPTLLGRIACVRSSDNHSIAEIGTKTLSEGAPRATYVKLSVLDDLRAIRLALHDHALLVRVGEPPKAEYTHFVHLEIEGNGFLGGLSLDFSPEMNVLIGGRGVGKSALLEVIRYALDLPAYAPTAYREGLVKHALGSGGKVVLAFYQVVRPGIERHYRIERVWDEQPRVFEGERSVSLSPLEVLGEREAPLFFGQREIYEVTQSARLRRRLLDEIIGRTAEMQLGQVKRITEELQRNARTILEHQERLAQRKDLEKRLQEIEHQIALYQQYGITQKLQQATALARDEERLKRAHEQLSQAQADWQEVQQRLAEHWTNALAGLKQADSVQAALLQQAAEVLRGLQDAFDGYLQQGEASFQQARAEFDRLLARWEQERRPLDEEIQRLKRELGTQSLDPDVLIRLTQEQEALRPQWETLRKIETTTANLQEERREKLADLREQRRQVFQLRQQQAQVISQALKDRVSVVVEYRGQRQEFAERLSAFFSGSGLDKESLRRLAEKGTDGIALAEWVRQGEKALCQNADLTSARAQQMLRFLEQNPQRIYELEVLAPEDEVEVQLKVNDLWLPLEKLSAGQRATAMLLILLTQHDRLLLIDQPEDDLDNRFIFDDVVPLLREQKGKRQIIAATHNPNIPVLGHAELVVALEAQEEHAAVAIQGAIDRKTVQDVVRRVMEGGEEAFRRRAEKYGLNIQGGSG